MRNVLGRGCLEDGDGRYCTSNFYAVGFTPAPHDMGPDANHQTGIGRKAVARIIDLQPKRRAFTPAGTASPRSMTFERPSTVLSDPDAADSLSASLDLALGCYKSRADEAY
jgi:hypothetical protein